MLCLWFWPGTEDYRSKLGGDCFADLACPEKCRCEGTTVDCSNQKLTKIPDHIPQYTAELWAKLFISTRICVCVCYKITSHHSQSPLPWSETFKLAWTSSSSHILRRLNNNEFTVLEATGIFKKLPQLRKMWVRHANVTRTKCYMWLSRTQTQFMQRNLQFKPVFTCCHPFYSHCLTFLSACFPLCAVTWVITVSLT